jgi:hypothetical protein
VADDLTQRSHAACEKRERPCIVARGRKRSKNEVPCSCCANHNHGSPKFSVISGNTREDETCKTLISKLNWEGVYAAERIQGELSM